MTTMSSKLMRGAGLAAAAGGGLFVGIQAIHPPDVLASVTTSAWTTVHCLGIAMSLFNGVGIVGIQARQADKAGWLGVVGSTLFGLFWAIAAAFQFAEAFVLPRVVADAPAFVESWMAMVSGSGDPAELGGLSAAWTVSGLLYLLGGLVFGVATIRAGVLTRWAAGLLAGGAIAAPVLTVLLPHTLVRSAALPMGLALVWLGYALWSERRQEVAQPTPEQRGLRLDPAGVK
jgi:hypothetical protein